MTPTEVLGGTGSINGQQSLAGALAAGCGMAVLEGPTVTSRRSFVAATDGRKRLMADQEGSVTDVFLA